MSVPEFCCPLCHGDLTGAPEFFRCDPCDRTYPVVEGIADFRVYPDSYISPADDHEKGRRLLRLAAGRGIDDLEGMARLYWEMTPEVEPARAERFIRAVCAAEERGAASLEVLRRRDWPETDGPLRFLEIGCGTGGLLAAAAASDRFGPLVGIDIAFRWLVIARARLARSGADATLVCACADFLPFRFRTFDLLIGEAVIEHVPDQPAALREARRTLGPGGILALRTVNRFSLACEPHVRVWGVGFLPRRMMNGYVRMVRGIPYRFHRLLSCSELTRLLRRAGFDSVRCHLPQIGPTELKHYPRTDRLLVRIYMWVSSWQAARRALLSVVPIFEVTARCVIGRHSPRERDSGSEFAAVGPNAKIGGNAT